MSEEFIAPEKRCTLPSCDHPKADPTEAGGLCEQHRAGLENAGNAESPSATESPESQSPPPTEGSDVESPDPSESDDGTPRHLECLADAIEFFQAQLDTDISDYVDVDTPREYFEAGRGWDPETLDAKQLGYAPADTHSLRDHLQELGYTREEMLATGLFYESLQPHFRGRYIFPYFDADGQPVYAISRSIDEEIGGHPRDQLGDQKYTKAVKTKDYSKVDEPIYGTESVRDGEPLLITEGMADAITAHENGHPCISPVTKQFKSRHHEPLLEILDAHNIPRVYLVQDSEEPSVDAQEGVESPESITDVLTIRQFGEGVEGAVRTAGMLAENDVDARVAELPRPGLRKVDLDDYLHDWGDIEPVLRSAAPATEHPAHDPKSVAIDAAEYAQERASVTASEDGSALFDLDIRDVTGLSWGYRGTNPLGHHGESENYFVLNESIGAYDHKYSVAYTPLTYLLVEAGERRANSPNGKLDDGEIFAAWRHAKEERLLPDDDPVPHRALRHVAIDGGHCSRDDIQDGWKLPQAAYNAALDTLEEEHGLEPGRDKLGTPTSEHETDPRELDVTLEPETAWRAASTVVPDDLDGEEELTLDITDDGDAWICPVTGEAVEVVRAVALDTGLIDQSGDALEDRVYDEAYRRAARFYGAPLPAYVTEETATDNWHLIQGALEQLTHRHLSEIESTVTTAGDGEDILAEIDPCWTHSVSGRRIIAYRAGAFYCREHERTLDPIRFVALEEGIIHECSDKLAGEDFREAYNIVREQRGAPLPEWTVGDPDHIPVLPPAEELLGEFSVDKQSLDDARHDVEALYCEAATDGSTNHLLTALPALGKTTSVVKSAVDIPSIYTAARHELMEEVAEKAAAYGVSWMHLPVFAEGRHQPREIAVNQGVARVREHGKQLLRDRDALLDSLEEPLYPETEPEDEDDEFVDLPRGSCSTANGQHGDAWALAVHVARSVGHSPQDIHTHDTALFGDTLPCQADGTECAYSEAWQAATDPDNPTDLLIGHYGHAHVAGARTHYATEDDRTELTPRAVAIDEFPGDAFGDVYGPEFADHATWLARSLHDAVDDRQSMLQTDLWNDDFVRAWLDGNATNEIEAVETAVAKLRALQEALTALETADELLADYHTATASLGAQGALEALLSRVHPEWEYDGIRDVYHDLRDVVEDTEPDRSEEYAAIELIEEILSPLATILVHADTGTDQLVPDAAPDVLHEDLAGMHQRAVTAFEQRSDGTDGLLEATKTALDGGADGCRELAVYTNDGYAHPDAYLLLYGLIAEGATVTDVSTNAFGFAPDGDGTNLKRVRVGRNTVLVDRNHAGAHVLAPPEFRARDGSSNPVIGLDATGREELWQLAIGTGVERIDIHQDQRREFLRDTLNVQVVQTTPHIKSYEGSVRSKNFSEDIALVEAVSKEFSATRLRSNTLTTATLPGVITTKTVREEIEDDLEGLAGAIDHYGNVTGSNALSERNIGIVLGSQHFGDAEVEKWAAFAGEEVHRSGHGNDLDYGSSIANTYLKHMRQDQTMQAILRFGRDEEGAVVFAHTSALHEDLPVVSEGAVVNAFSRNAQEVARVAKDHLGSRFTASDIADHVSCSRRTVRRVLAEFTDLGYLQRRDPGAGRANSYRTVEEPGMGDVDLPDLDSPGEGGGQEPVEEYYTWFVRVDESLEAAPPGRAGSMATLPAPGGTARSAPPG